MIRHTTKAIKKVSRYLIPAVIGLGVALPCLSVNAAQGVRATEPYMFVVSFRDDSPDKASGMAGYNIKSSFIGSITNQLAHVGKAYKGWRQRQFSGSADIDPNKTHTINVTKMSVPGSSQSADCTPNPVIVKFPIDKEMVSIVVDYLGLKNDGTPSCKVTTTFA